MGVLTPEPDEIPVVGVVADAHDPGVETDPQPEIYSPAFGPGAVLLVRSSADMQDIETLIRAAVQSVVPGQPVYGIEAMTSVLSQSLARQETTATLLGIFSLAALLLAAMGIYGVFSYSMSQRTREIGVRMASGASRIQIVLIVLREVTSVLSIGIAAGLIASFGLAHLVGGILFRVQLSAGYFSGYN